IGGNFESWLRKQPVANHNDKRPVTVTTLPIVNDVIAGRRSALIFDSLVHVEVTESEAGSRAGAWEGLCNYLFIAFTRRREYETQSAVDFAVRQSGADPRFVRVAVRHSAAHR